MKDQIPKMFFYRIKSVRGRNSVKSITRVLDILMDALQQPEFVQVNVQDTDGKLYRIKDVQYNRHSQSLNLKIDLNEPMQYPEFWPHRVNNKAKKRKNKNEPAENETNP